MATYDPTNEYTIDSDTYELFSNIALFAKNMTLKDSKSLDEAETDLSRKLGRYLIKYYEENLTNADIADLIKIVGLYNYEIRQTFYDYDSTTKTYSYDLENVLPKIVGVPYKQLTDATGTYYEGYAYSGINVSDSLFSRIITYLISLYTEDVESGVSTFAGNDTLSSIGLRNGAIRAAYEIIWNLLKGSNISYSTDESTEFNDPSDLREALEKYQASEDTSTVESNRIWTTVSGEYPNITDSSYICGYLYNTYKTDIEKCATYYIDAIIYSEMIHVDYPSADEGSGRGEKRSASSRESGWAESGFPLAFFDLKNIALNPSDFGDSSYGSSIINEIANTGTNSKLVSIVIEYKELNPEYRSILNSDLHEVASTLLGIFDVNTETLTTNYFDSTDDVCSLVASLESSYRNLTDDYGLLFRESWSNDKFRYQYANPYKVRAAINDEVISYYYGDSYTELSNGYGIYSYQVTEINNFLDIYAETREYFYKVLLNKAFANESLYNAYIRLFMTAVSIERFIDSKISTLKDVDSMDSTDITNFMESYGLKDLNDSLNGIGSGFIGQEEYLKRMIKNHFSFIQKKGSKDCIDLITEIFDYDSDDISIQKHMLVDCEFDSNVLGYSKTNEDGTTEFEEISSSDIAKKYCLMSIREYEDSSSGTTVAVPTISFDKYSKTKDTAGKYYETYNFAQAYGGTYTVLSSLSSGEFKNCSSVVRIFFEDTLFTNVTGYIYLGLSSDGITRYICSLSELPSNEASYLPSEYDKAHAYPVSKDMSFSTDESKFYIGDWKIIIGEISEGEPISYGTLAYTDSTNRYKVTTNDYTSTNWNLTKNLMNTIDSATLLRTFVENDPYWNIDKVPESVITDAGIDTSELKYLSLTLTKNIFENFVKMRYFVSIAKHICSLVRKSGKETIIPEITPSAESFGETTISMDSLLTLLCALYDLMLREYELLGATLEKESATSSKYYGLNTSYFDSDDSLSESDTFIQKMTTVSMYMSRSLRGSFSSTASNAASNINIFDEASGTSLKSLSESITSDGKTYLSDIVERRLLASASLLLYDVAYSNVSTAEELYTLKTDTLIRYLYGISGNIEEKLIKMIDSAIEFPTEYLSSRIDTQSGSSSDYVKFCNEFFENFYLSDKDCMRQYSESIISADKNAIQALLSAYGLSEIITIVDGEDSFTLKMMDELSKSETVLNNSMLAMIDVINTIRLSSNSSEADDVDIYLTESVSNELDFMTAVIKRYISYTSYLYNSDLAIMIDNESDALEFSDDVAEVEINQTRGDNVFYDEKFNIYL